MPHHENARLHTPSPAAVQRSDVSLYQPLAQSKRQIRLMRIVFTDAKESDTFRQAQVESPENPLDVETLIQRSKDARARFDHMRGADSTDGKGWLEKKTSQVLRLAKRMAEVVMGRQSRDREAYSNMDRVSREIEDLADGAPHVNTADWPPSDPSQHITCELSTFRLEDAPDYTALSYCWTHEDPSCVISVNGHSTFVRPNLHAYLQLMRKERQDCWLFVDAISINQLDIAERSSQVGLMGSIYGRASIVVAWLGLSPSYWVSRYLETLVTVCEWLQQHADKSDNVYKALKHDAVVQLLVRLTKVISARPYWSRLWIAPEALLARTFLLRYDILCFDARPLAIFMKWFMVSKGMTGLNDPRDIHRSTLWRVGHGRMVNKGAMTTGELSAYQILLEREKLETRVTHMEPRKLWMALVLFPLQQSAEPHDKIFGFLGLTDSNIKPDYSMPLSLLLVRVAMECQLEMLMEVDLISPSRLAWFYAALLTSLNLSPSDPAVVVALTTAAKFLDHDDILSKTVMPLMFHSLRTWPRSLEMLPAGSLRWMLQNFCCRISWRTTLLLTRFYQLINKRISPPGDSGTMQKCNDWGKRVREDTDSILSQLPEDVRDKIRSRRLDIEQRQASERLAAQHITRTWRLSHVAGTTLLLASGLLLAYFWSDLWELGRALKHSVVLCYSVPCVPILSSTLHKNMEGVHKDI